MVTVGHHRQLSKGMLFEIRQQCTTAQARCVIGMAASIM